MRPTEGSMVGRYRLDQIVGRGGMAGVYRAEDTRLQRTVAVKLIHPERIGDSNAVERFLREARTVASLEHPNILPIYDLGEQDGSPYLVAPFIGGGTLNDRLADRPPSPQQTAEWLYQLADALDCAHERRVLHRDVKPGNILLSGERPVLADFGIAKLEDGATDLTDAGQVLGTPLYIAPELAIGRRAVPASDQYSLAVVAFQMLTGAPPFDGATPLAVLHQHVHQQPPTLGDRGLAMSLGVEAALERGLAKRPEDRYESCRDFAAALLSGLDLPIPAPTAASARTAALAEAAVSTELDRLAEAIEDVEVTPRPPRARGLGLAVVIACALAAAVAAPRLFEPGADEWMQLSRPIGRGPAAFAERPDAESAAAVPTSSEATPRQPTATDTRPRATPRSAAVIPPPRSTEDGPATAAVETGTTGGAPDIGDDRGAADGSSGDGSAADEMETGTDPEPAAVTAPRDGTAIGDSIETVPAAGLSGSDLSRPAATVDTVDPEARARWEDLLRRSRDQPGPRGRAGERYAQGGLAYLEGNDAAARAALADLRASGAPDLPRLVSLLPDGAAIEDWQLALIYDDVRGEGLDAIARAIDADPSDPRPRLGEAMLLRESGRAEEALQRAIELHAETAAVRPEVAGWTGLFIGETLVLQNDAARAGVWMDRVAAAGVAASGRAAYRAAQLAQRTGDLTRARERLDTACRLGNAAACRRTGSAPAPDARPAGSGPDVDHVDF